MTESRDINRSLLMCYSWSAHLANLAFNPAQEFSRQPGATENDTISIAPVAPVAPVAPIRGGRMVAEGISHNDTGVLVMLPTILKKMVSGARSGRGPVNAGTH